MNKKEIIDEIARKHHIILDENDPIIAVISANEMILDEYIQKVDQLLTKHKLELETYKIGIKHEFKEHIEANKQVMQVMSEQNRILATNIENLNNHQEAPQTQIPSKNHIFIFLTSQVLFLLLGLVIGVLI